MEALVSIVVPIYNMEQYLDRCLESVVNQTYERLEILLVDDGSTDSSSTVCDRWAAADSRITVIHKQNGGLGMARNTGLDHASGDYIFFLDSDDYVDTTLVEKCIRSVCKHNAEIVLFGRYNVYENGTVTLGTVKAGRQLYRGSEIQTEILPSLFTYELGFGVSAWSRMYSVKFLKNNALRFVSEREIISEDAFFSLPLFAAASAVSIVPESLYYYCRRDSSLSRRYQAGRQERNDIFLVKSLEKVEELGLPEAVKTHIQARYHGMTLGTLMQIKRSDLSRCEKKREIFQILHNKNLQATLTKDVCRLDAKLPRLFWSFLRKKWYFLCVLLLYCRARR